jgi:DNA-binding transcriptional MerR regulator
MVPTTTLRYCERLGLRQPDSRTVSNYRVYGSAALERVRFIRAGQANGFPLEQMALLLTFSGDRPFECERVQGLLTSRLTEIERRLQELRHLRRSLVMSLERCRDSMKTGRCHVIDRLSHEAAVENGTGPDKNPVSPRKKRT